MMEYFTEHCTECNKEINTHNMCTLEFNNLKFKLCFDCAQNITKYINEWGK